MSRNAARNAFDVFLAVGLDAADRELARQRDLSPGQRGRAQAGLRLVNSPAPITLAGISGVMSDENFPDFKAPGLAN
jgi:hypothetical protein